MILILLFILLVLYLLPVYKSPKILNDFLSPEERQHIIKEASGRLSDSLVDTNGSLNKDVRQSRTAWLQKTDPIVRSVMERCVGHVNKTIDHCEQLQVLHYEEGGHYKPHQDAFIGDENSRLYTFILALTDDYEGGETEFPNVRKSYKLKAGDALFFHTLDSYGLDTSKALHGGKPVKSGEKWICNLWIRERPYS